MLGEVLTAIVTPFHPDGTVNVPKFRELAAHLVDNGSDGLVVAGTTGEASTLTRWTSSERSECRVPAVPAGVDLLSVDIAATHPRHASWSKPVRVYFRRHGGNPWTLVGFDRLQPAS